MRINKDILIGDTTTTLEQINTNTNDINNLKPVILYSNENGVSSGTITLSDSSANYSYIEILGKVSDGYNISTKIYLPNGKSSELIGMAMDGNIYVKMLTFSISTNIITIIQNKQWYKYYGNSNGGYENTNVAITRVLGYK